MNKTRQHELMHWLKKQRSPVQFWLRLSMLLGLLAAGLIIVQAGLLATLLQSLIVDQLPPPLLLKYFGLLIITSALRALGTFYHAKAQALGAAESLVTFLTSEAETTINTGNKKLSGDDPITLIANQLEIIATDGTRLAGPLNFSVVVPGNVLPSSVIPGREKVHYCLCYWVFHLIEDQ